MFTVQSQNILREVYGIDVMFHRKIGKNKLNNRNIINTIYNYEALL